MDAEVQAIEANRKKKGYLIRKNFRRNWQLYLFLLPLVAYFFIFHYIPMAGIQIGFKDYYANRGMLGSPWVGFKHFERFFDSYFFWRLLRNTLILNAYQLMLFPLPVIFALSLNELKNGAFKKWAQTLTYAPHFISVIVIVGMIMAFTDVNSGLINNILKLFGAEPIAFMNKPEWFRHLFVWSGVWQSLGWNTIIFLAALAGINPELHEAARVDGASKFQRVIHVNVPGIMPTVVILFILGIGQFMQIGFEKVLAMQNTLNSATSDIIQTFVYKRGILEGQTSFATAIGLFESIINIILLVVVNQIARKIGEGENSLW